MQGYNMNFQPGYNPQGYYNPTLNYQEIMMQRMNQEFNQQNQNGYKLVDSIESVKATDIPMDGKMYFFPKADGSMIYSKQWLQNGTTKIMEYKPNIEEQNEEVLKINSYDEILDKINEVLQRLDKIEKTSKSYSTRGKKEVNENELRNEF